MGVGSGLNLDRQISTRLPPAPMWGRIEGSLHGGGREGSFLLSGVGQFGFMGRVVTGFLLVGETEEEGREWVKEESSLSRRIGR